MIHVLLADGFEEIEALSTVDILRRAELNVCMVSIMGRLQVVGAHGIKVEADSLLQADTLDKSELIVLPGGMPGAKNLHDNEQLGRALLAQNEAGRPIAAICAAPYVLGELGILQGRRATCYPGFEGHLHGATVTGELVERDGLIVTGKGPAAANPFALALVEMLAGTDAALQVAQGMLLR